MVHSKEKITLYSILKILIPAAIISILVLIAGCNPGSSNINEEIGKNDNTQEVNTQITEDNKNDLTVDPKITAEEPIISTVSHEPIMQINPETPIVEKKFIISGSNFKFYQEQQANPTLTVSEGDSVEIEFYSDFGYHDWVLDEFNAATKRVRPDDGITVIKFVADKKGTFEYYCSVGSHRQQGMEGKFIVE